VTVADKAAAILHGGGVIAYPTEGVFGLGCLPDHLDAVERVLKIKQRDASKGLILMAANSAQFDGWIQLPDDTNLPEVDPDKPITWIVPTASRVKAIIRGDNVGIAVRITSNPVARSICDAVNSPIVSTSANLSGKAVAGDQLSLHRQFRSLVDYIVPGECGPATGPSEIRHLATGAVLRPR
jgi:L-threonylcarbamoyladenylate synthase